MSRRAHYSTKFARSLRCEALEDRRLLAVVTSAADSGPGTLRDALASGDPTITFDVPAMGTSTIVLTSGNLLVPHDVAIDGDDGMGGRVTVDGSAAFSFRMSDYNGGNFLDQSISNMIITNGYSSSDGGGIQSFENLTLDNVLITDSYSLNDAGGLGFGDEGTQAGDLVITNSSITNNFAVDDGGGLDFYNGISLTIVDSDISGNTIGRATDPNIAGSKVGGGARVIDTFSSGSGQVINIDNSNFENNVIQGTMSGAQALIGAGNGVIFVNLSEYFSGISRPQFITVTGGTVSGNIQDFTDLDGPGSVADPYNSYTPDGSGGGFYFSGSTDVLVEDTAFDNNYAYGSSNGIYLTGAFEQFGVGLGTIRATFNNIVMTNHSAGPRGNLTNNGGAFGVAEYTNGNYIDIEVEINDSTITGNSAELGGGVVSRGGADLSINNSEISGNYAAENGGGLYVIGFGYTATVDLNATTIADNTATFNGAGISLRDTMPNGLSFDMNNSTVSGNIGLGDTSNPAYPDLGDGGGIFADGVIVNINQSTISYNQTPTDGGGIFFDNLPQNANIRQSTIYGNSADRDNGGAGNGVGVGGGVALTAGNIPIVDISNSVISGNADSTGPNDIDDAGSGHIYVGNSYVGGTPLLGPLQLNAAGTTETHEPLPGSPLIDAGDDMLAPFATDQNGSNRVSGVSVDLGSVEAQFGPDCDFDDDGDYDCDDLDMLTKHIAGGGNDLSFDLNGDGVCDLLDVEMWRVDAGAWPANIAITGGNAFLAGDANCDGAVDAADFIAWNSNKFTLTGNNSRGDFNASGFVDASDFMIWQQNKFTTSRARSSDGSPIAPVQIPGVATRESGSALAIRSDAITVRFETPREMATPAPALIAAQALSPHRLAEVNRASMHADETAHNVDWLMAEVWA